MLQHEPYINNISRLNLRSLVLETLYIHLCLFSAEALFLATLNHLEIQAPFPDKLISYPVFDIGHSHSEPPTVHHCIDTKFTFIFV